MSALWAPLGGVAEGGGTRGRASTRPTREGERRLRAVPDAPARLARVPFIAVLIAVFVLGMAVLLMVNTTLQNQAFESRALNREAAQLAYAQADLQSQIEQVSAPQALARRASALGMRPNPYPAFLEVPSGKVTGKRTRIDGMEARGLVVKTPAELAEARAVRAARAAAKAKAEAAAKAKAAAAAKRKAAEAAKKKAAAEAEKRERAARAAGRGDG